jgi:hypothetical protein
LMADYFWVDLLVVKCFNCSLSVQYNTDVSVPPVTLNCSFLDSIHFCLVLYPYNPTPVPVFVL